MQPLCLVKVLEVGFPKLTVASKAKPHAEELGTASLTLAKKFSAYNLKDASRPQLERPPHELSFASSTAFQTASRMSASVNGEDLNCLLRYCVLHLMPQVAAHLNSLLTLLGNFNHSGSMRNLGVWLLQPFLWSGITNCSALSWLFRTLLMMTCCSIPCIFICPTCVWTTNKPSLQAPRVSHMRYKRIVSDDFAGCVND